MSKIPMTRRSLIQNGIFVIGSAVVGSSLLSCSERGAAATPGAKLKTRYRTELAASASCAAISRNWGGSEINALLDSMGDDSLKRTCKTLGVRPDRVRDYTDLGVMRSAIRDDMAAMASKRNSSASVDYHRHILVPAAHKCGVDADTIANGGSYRLEQAVYRRTLEAQWNSLTEDQRVEFLRGTGWHMSERKIYGLAGIAGAGILAALTGVVSFTGFAFYMGMSSGLAALAGSLGLTLPFAAYMAASSAVALATGPIGWIVVGLLFLLGIWSMRDRGDHESERVKYVLHVHNYRVAAMTEGGLALPA
jgi:hypothetical protein